LCPFDLIEFVITNWFGLEKNSYVHSRVKYSEFKIQLAAFKLCTRRVIINNRLEHFYIITHKIGKTIFLLRLVTINSYQLKTSVCLGRYIYIYKYIYYVCVGHDK